MSNVEDSLRSLLECIAVEARYEEFEVTTQRVSSGGANYTSSLHSATISAPARPTLQLFVKVAAVSEHLRQVVFINFYETELFFYMDLARIYDRIQDQHCVRGEDRLIFPKFYGCDVKYPHEIVVLENLQTSGFTSCDRREAMNWTYAAKTVDEMAKFHALSIAYGQEDPEASKKLLSKFEMELPATRAFMEDLVMKMYDKALSVMSNENKEKLNKFFATHGDMNSFIELKKPLRLPVLAHGDFKKTNLMHKVTKEGQLQMTIIDYQTLNSSSVISDLLFFIFTSTDQQFRRQHYERLVEHYYERLGRALGRLGVDISQVYPREDFDYELKKVLPLGLCYAMVFLPVMLVRDEDAPPVDAKMEEEDFVLKHDGLYAERLNEVVDDYVEWGVM